LNSVTIRICVGVFLSSACFFLAVPLIPLYIVQLDPQSPLAGPTIAISFVLSAALSPLWGTLAERYGPKPMLVRAAGLVSIAYALSAWATSVEALFAARCLAGVASGFVPVATSALVRLSDADRRSTDMGWLSSAKSAGALLGPSVGGLLVWLTGSFRLTFLVAACASLLTVAVALSLPAMPPEPDDADGSAADTPPAESTRSTSLVIPALALTFLLASAGMLVQIWLPFALGKTHGAVDAAGIVGLVLACTSGATMLLAPLWGRLADRRRRGQVLVATVVLPIPLLAALGPVDGVAAIAVLFLAASALGSEAVALLGAEVSRKLPQRHIGPYFGWSNTVTQVGSAIAAALTPALVGHSLDLPIWLCVALYVAGAAVVALLVRTLRQENSLAFA